MLGSEALGEGDVVAAAGCELRVLVTPGHTSDSLSFLLVGPGTEPAVLTGDTVLGRGTTVIAHPDGALGPYLGSLRRLSELVDGTTVLPGHGPELPDAPSAARYYLAHREERLEQVRTALKLLGPHDLAAAGRRARLHRRRRGAVGAAELSVRRSWSTCAADPPGPREPSEAAFTQQRGSLSSAV